MKHKKGCLLALNWNYKQLYSFVMALGHYISKYRRSPRVLPRRKVPIKRILDDVAQQCEGKA